MHAPRAVPFCPEPSGETRKKRKQNVHVTVVGKPKNNTEKHLLSDNREFASIFQLVLKDERINPDELRDYSETDTVTKVEGGEISLSKEFVRDIRKLWVKTDGRIENLVENVIKLSKVKNYSYEESLDILKRMKKKKKRL